MKQRESEKLTESASSGNSGPVQHIMLIKYIENFTTKTENFQIKILIYFIFLLKTYCEYSLEPPRRGGSNEYPQSTFFNRNKKK